MKSNEFPDDPTPRCGYFFLSLPCSHPFTDCCAAHDKHYGDPDKSLNGFLRGMFSGMTHDRHVHLPQDIGGAWVYKTRKEVDLQFLSCMLIAIKRQKLTPVWWYKLQAMTMYRIVRLIGGPFWPGDSARL